MSDLSILFIGNSHTFCNDLPLMLQRLFEADKASPSLKVRSSTFGGKDFTWHWNYKGTRRLIDKGGWDFIVLQNRSGGPLEEKESMLEHGRLLDQEIKKVNAKTLLYMTWALKGEMETQPQITQAYEKLAGETGSLLAPVGLAWKSVLESGEPVELFDLDGQHANPAGTYVAACTFYSLLNKKSAEGLPPDPQLEPLELGPQQIALLQRCAFEAYADQGR